MTIVAESNSGKTTFAMDIIARNSDNGRKCMYVNLEFDIRTMRRSRWLWINKKKKRNLTDLDPLTSEEQKNMDAYVDNNIDKFDHHNNPNGMELDDMVKFIIDKSEE